MKFLDLLLGSFDGEIVLAPIRDVAAPFQHFAHLIHHLIYHSRLCLNAHVEFVGVRIDLAEGTEGNEHTAVFVSHAKPAFGLLHNTDDHKGGTVDHDIFSDRMAFGKQHGRHVFSQHHDLFPVQVIAFADESALNGGSIGVDLAEIGLHSAKINGRHFTGFCANRMGLVPAGHDEGSNVFDRGTTVLECFFVFNGEGLALPFLERRRAVVPPLVPFRDKRRIRAELLDLLFNLLVEAREYPGDKHNHAHSQDHPEYG